MYSVNVVRRTNINLDMQLVEQAARELGTRRTTDTVHQALRDVVARARRARLAERDFEAPHARAARRAAPHRTTLGVKDLADTSAWVWSRRSAAELRRDFDTALVDGEIATCDMVRLELLYSARNAGEFADIRTELEALPDCAIGKTQWERALWVYQRLSAKGGAHQRSVKHADLLIAAAAEAAGAGVLHYDEDYDRIAEITRQPTRWLAPRGSLG